jgi:hypothetical protein
MKWQVPRMWEGGDVWIIGGGPSVPKQFGIPDSVVQDVISGTLPPSTYSPYMREIHDKHVIGINVAYLIGDWIDIVFFGDDGFFKNHKYGLAEFPGLKVSCAPDADKVDWVYFLPRNTGHARGISDDPTKVSWNHNSGCAAISVAANAGAKRIILLGFDMSLNKTSNQHWHDVYKRGVIKEPKRIASLPFNRHLRSFPDIAKDAKVRGVEIINASPDSAITQFRKTTVAELLV